MELALKNPVRLVRPKRTEKSAIEADFAQVAAERTRRRAFIQSVIRKVLAVALTLAVCVLMCVYVNNPFGYVPLVLVILAVVADFACVQVLSRQVTWRQESRVGDCPRGEDIDFRIRVSNRSILFMFHARAHFFVSDLFGGLAMDNPADFVLGPFESRDFDITVNFKHLGTYTAGIDRIEFFGFLGLFVRTVEGGNRAEVQVTPTIHSIERIGFSTDTPSESRVALKTVADDSMDYSGVREYHRGDPLKRMHWALSAKGNKTLYTKIYETPTNPGVGIILDFAGPSGLTADELGGMFDTVVESAFSISEYARGIGLEVELEFIDRFGTAVRKSSWKRDELAELVDDMPRMQPGGESHQAAELVNSEAHSMYAQGNIVICTALPSAEIVDAAIAVKIGRRNPVVVLAIPEGLSERERIAWCAPLERLSASGIGYTVLDSPDAIGKVNVA